MKVFSFFVFLAAIVATSQGSDSYCLSWRLAVETNTIRDWETVPEKCESYMEHYFSDADQPSQYRADSKAVTDEAWRYAQSLELAEDGKNIWVFDIDETTLSNLPYYEEHHFGTEKLNKTALEEWFMKGEAPALEETLKLYNNLLSLHIKIVFLTGRAESMREIVKTNLHNAKYEKWEKLILKPDSSSETIFEFKSNERRKFEEQDRYRIIGNMGDQWSDIQGIHPGNWTFKLPNPLYYIPSAHNTRKLYFDF